MKKKIFYTLVPHQLESDLLDILLSNIVEEEIGEKNLHDLQPIFYLPTMQKQIYLCVDNGT